MNKRRTTTTLLALLTLSIGFGGQLNAQAQSEDASTRALRELVATEQSPAAQDHQVIQSFLERIEVREAAQGHGIDMERVRTGAATLNDRAASDLADRIETLQDQALAGGDTLVISASTIVIVLLILILVAVA